MTTTQGRLESIYPALLAIINNIAPYVRDLQRATSSKLLDLFASLSSPRYLLEKEGNHAMLLSLLQAMNAILEHQYEGMFCPILFHVVFSAFRGVLWRSLVSFSIAVVLSVPPSSRCEKRVGGALFVRRSAVSALSFEVLALQLESLCCPIESPKPDMCSLCLPLSVKLTRRRSQSPICRSGGSQPEAF